MKDRTKSILDAAVRDFIQTGIPITSERLFETYDFGIKPAMIRRELNDLAELGYFFQLHPSGGRTPTNRAYRFFVNELLKEGAARQAAGTRSLVSDFLRKQHKVFIEEIAEYLHVFGVGYAVLSDEVYESSLWSLIDRLEIEAKREILNVVHDIETLPGRLGQIRSRWLDRDDVWPRVFIGQSPVTTSEHLSVVASRFGSSDGDFLLMAIGPKRMDYQKTIALFRELRASCAPDGIRPRSYDR